MKGYVKNLSAVILMLSCSTPYAGDCTSSALSLIGDGSGGSGVCCDDATRAQATAAGGTMTCFMPADTYNFTMISFGFERDDGTIFDFGSETTFNGASATVGAAFGSLVSGASLPTGTYVAVRPIIKRNFVVGRSTTATTASGDTCPFITSANNDMPTSINNGPGSPTVPNCSASPLANNCILNSTDMRIRDTQLGNLVIDGTTPLTINFNFDASAGVMYSYTAGGTCTAIGTGMGPMAVTMTQS